MVNHRGTLRISGKSASKQVDILLNQINSESIPLDVVLGATVMMIDNSLSNVPQRTRVEKLLVARRWRDLISKHIMKLYDLEDELDLLVESATDRNRHKRR